MSLFDSWGESLSGLTDSIVNGGEQLVDAWFDGEADKVQSAAPEENRPKQEAAQQPTGQPIIYGGMNTNTMMLMGGGFVLLMMFIFLMMKGK
ncbi:hypothetical protein [Photobacterium lipolyticum]|uniref:Uncharacterized protein n=1 Tax=Photobacterium lipolyticum TaxID=266810 RepID=A0A2T3N1W5_9GAMM|nr:hypothetical protein [Photobacterium lipolyticum]PSW06268.1 hypothetical protein C9I89_07100 [Photobacterium lipolyticum]